MKTASNLCLFALAGLCLLSAAVAAEPPAKREGRPAKSRNEASQELRPIRIGDIRRGRAPGHGR